MAALALLDVSQDFFALLWLYIALKNASDAAPNKPLFTMVYAAARRCTCRTKISSAGSSPLTRKLRIGCAQDGASTTVMTATGVMVAGLGGSGL